MQEPFRCIGLFEFARDKCRKRREHHILTQWGCLDKLRGPIDLR